MLEWIEKDLLLAIASQDTQKDRWLIALDVFASQKTASVLQAFRSHNIVAVFFPEGYTGLVQPMDTFIIIVLKEIIWILSDEEVENNSDIWENDFSISDRRIIITKVSSCYCMAIAIYRAAATYSASISLYWSFTSTRWLNRLFTPHQGFVYFCYWRMASVCFSTWWVWLQF